MAGLTLSKSELALRLGLSKSRVSQLVAQGLPVEPDGLVDALAAARWVLDTLCDLKAEPTRQAARELLRQVDPADAEPGDIDWLGPVDMAWVLREVAIAAVLAGAEVGMRREAAERLADLVALFFWGSMNEPLKAEGLPEGIPADLDAVLAWRERVNWPALFGPDSASLVAGKIAAQSRAELAEEAARA
jgi:hypothetical protein